MAFDDIVGNDRIKNILKKVLQKQRLPHALMLQGPSGVGKKDLALVAAKALNCLNKTDDSCEICENCRAVNEERFPDVLVLAPQKNVHELKQMQFLKETAFLKPMVGKKRVFVIEHADKVSPEAGSAPLKILEEPPLFTHIILTTERPQLVLPTIHSRCQVLTLSPVSREDITRQLLKKGYTEEQANLIALLVGGNINQAMNLEWESVQALRARALDILQACFENDGVATLLYEMTKSRAVLREDLERILEVHVTVIRDLLLLKEGGPRELLINADYEERLFALQENLDFRECLDLSRAIEYAVYALQRRVNPALLVNFILSRYMEHRHV